MSFKRMCSIFIPALVIMMFAGSVLADNPPTRITFSPGATSAAVSAQVDSNTPANYVIYALAGQYMQVAMTWMGGPAYLTVVSPGGSPLARAQAGAQSYAGNLPETGDYRISVSVFPGAPTTLFTAGIAIAPLAQSAATAQAPVVNTGRIQFATGTNTEQVVGQVSGQDGSTIYDYYLLNAQAGQTMSIALAQFANPIYLTVVSPNGSPLARAQNGAQSFNQVLTESGDYQLRISTAPGVGLSYYELLVSVVNNGQQPVSSVSATRPIPAP